MFNTGGQNYLDIDASELDGLVRDMRRLHTPENFQKLIVRALRRTGSQVRTMVDREVRKEYSVKKGWVMGNLGSPKISQSAISCSIPIDGERGVHGWQFKTSKPRGRPAKGRRYKIATHMVKGQTGELPEKMKNQGGNPPFIGPNGIIFTRKTDKRLPIVRVAGIGIPQMPMNEAKDAIQDRTIEILKKRIEHEHEVLMRRLVK